MAQGRSRRFQSLIQPKEERQRSKSAEKRKKEDREERKHKLSLRIKEVHAKNIYLAEVNYYGGKKESDSDQSMDEISRMVTCMDCKSDFLVSNGDTLSINTVKSRVKQHGAVSNEHQKCIQNGSKHAVQCLQCKKEFKTIGRGWKMKIVTHFEDICEEKGNENDEDMHVKKEEVIYKQEEAIYKEEQGDSLNDPIVIDDEDDYVKAVKQEEGLPGGGVDEEEGLLNDANHPILIDIDDEEPGGVKKEEEYHGIKPELFDSYYQSGAASDPIVIQDFGVHVKQEDMEYNFDELVDLEEDDDSLYEGLNGLTIGVNQEEEQEEEQEEDVQSNN
eukprot:247663_1